MSNLLAGLPPLKNSSFVYALTFVIGFFAAIGSLWDVFGWANLAVLALYLLPALVFFNFIRPDFVPCDWKSYGIYLFLPVSILVLNIFQAIWIHPVFPGYPEGLTNQEWIRFSSYFLCFLSIPLFCARQCRIFWLGFSLGLASYGLGTIILTFFSDNSFKFPFDMHFGGPWGTPSNPTPPGIAIVVFVLIISYLLLSSSLSKWFKLHSFLIIYIPSVFSLFLLDKRSSLAFVLLSTVLYSSQLLRLFDFDLRTFLSKRNAALKFALIAASSFVLYLVITSRLFTNIFITISQGPAVSDPDRWFRYSYGFKMLEQSLFSGYNHLIEMPYELESFNVHWHNGFLDSYRIGDLLGFVCFLIWILFLVFQLFKLQNHSFLRLSSLFCLLILMVEPTLHRTWIDGLSIQFLSVFICYPRKILQLKNSTS